jgi:acetoin utilization protein AcuB
MSTLLVADYMTRSVHSVGVNDTLAVAHRLMRKNQIHHLPVLAARRLVGIVSMEDLHLIETLKDVDSETVTVEEAMSPSPYTVSSTTPLRVATRHMWKHKVGSAVVMEKRVVIGVFTLTDALQALTEVLAPKPQRAVRGAQRRRH